MATQQAVDLSVSLGRLQLKNPILVASGTFGYAREMAGLVELNRLGAILPKTITQLPREGNAPPRTFETTGGMLNSWPTSYVPTEPSYNDGDPTAS